MSSDEEDYTGGLARNRAAPTRKRNYRRGSRTTNDMDGNNATIPGGDDIIQDITDQRFSIANIFRRKKKKKTPEENSKEQEDSESKTAVDKPPESSPPENQT